VARSEGVVIPFFNLAGDFDGRHVALVVALVLTWAAYAQRRRAHASPHEQVNRNQTPKRAA